MKKTFFFLFCAIVTMPVSLAQGSSPGGSDGCGLGWQVTTKKSMFGTTTRGTTNSVVPPTFGMTSGTIGCDQHSLAAKDIPGANYVVTNLDNLKHEMAIGSGETLWGLSSVMGCTDTDVFAQTLKKSYAEIVGSDQISGIEMFKNIKRATRSGCQV